MTGILYPLAVSALPYVVHGASSWLNASIKTYGPKKVADATILAAEATGSKLMGNRGVLGRIGGTVGKVFGWAAAPLVAQSTPVQGNILFASETIGALGGALIQVGGNYLINRAANKQAEADQALAWQQVMAVQQFQAQQLHAQWANQMNVLQGGGNGSQIETKQLLEFSELVKEKNGQINIKDLQEFLKRQNGVMTIQQLQVMLQLVQGFNTPDVIVQPV